MSQSYTLLWTTTEAMIIEPSQILFTDPKYRVDCYPDSACYIPKDKGGYQQTDSAQQLTDAVTRYSLSPLSIKPRLNRVNANYHVDSRQLISNVKQLSIT
ncbi:unnamed protein product [Rotaria sp. Silwood1]|nr:unnamed protein product [Rotaria sp. Silwood1]